MKIQLCLFVLWAELFSILSCSREKSPVAPSQEILTKLTGIEVRTDKSQYVANDTLEFAVSNYSDDTVHIATCCRVAFWVEIWQNGAWLEYGPGFIGPCIALCQGWLDLAARDMITEKFFWGHGDLAMMENGTWRISIECRRNGDHFWVKSNAFVLMR